MVANTVCSSDTVQLNQAMSFKLYVLYPPPEQINSHYNSMSVHNDSENRAVVSELSQSAVSKFSNPEQRSWFKIECVRGRIERQYHQGL